MDVQSPPFKKYIFVCENVRKEGEISCGPTSIGEGYVKQLKEEVAKRGLKGIVRISRTGCLDVCNKGPNLLVYPEGRWYMKVAPDDLKEIMERELTI